MDTNSNEAHPAPDRSIACAKSDAISSNEVLATIAQEAAAADLSRPDSLGIFVRLVLAGFVLVVLLTVAWSTESIGYTGLAAMGVGLACVQIGFIAHDASHGGVPTTVLGNSVAGHLAFTILNGLGFSSWRESHNDHHQFCQDESRDPDMAVDVVMSLTPESAARKTGIGRMLLPFQAFMLWPISLFFAHSLRIASIGRAYGSVNHHVADAVLLPLHYVLWFAVPTQLFGTDLGRVIAVYLICSAVMGTYLAVLFWVNHVGMPSWGEGDEVTRLEQQVIGTRNVRHAAWLDFAFGGLDFQIEHHLMPQVSNTRLRTLQGITRAHCKAAGLPYREESLVDALTSVTRHVQRIAKR